MFFRTVIAVNDIFTTAEMHNYSFDLEEWLARIPLEIPGENSHYEGVIVTGPSGICNNEHLRRGLRSEFRWGTGVPVDIFVMAKGEPEDRHVTKIGGLPYRPADEEWPVNAEGAPLLFLGQVNFGDSKDLTGELPGDILLVFSDWVDDGSGSQFSGYIEDIVFEWQNYSSMTLISQHQIPSHLGLFPPTYGYRCRVLNYPDAERLYDSEYQK